MRPTRWILPALAWLLATADPTAAQLPEERTVRLVANPYVGVFVFDDSDLKDDFGLEVDIGPMLGVRVGASLGDDWLVEGAWGYASATVERSEFVDFPPGELEQDLAVHLLYAAGNYFIDTEVAPTRLMLGGGLGVAIVDPETGEADADFMIDLAAGFTHPINDRITFRGEFRDHIGFCQPADEEDEFFACAEEEPLHHFEISGGLQFWFR